MKKTLLLLLTVITIFNSQSQETWTTYNSSNSNLTFNEIEDIEFDSEGNTWVSSWFNHGGDGIAKFDGTNWTVFNTENNDSNGLNFDKIEFRTGELEEWVSVYATAVIGISDGSQMELHIEHDRNLNILTIDIPEGAVNITVEYYIEDDSQIVSKSLFNNEDSISQENLEGSNTYNFSYGFDKSIIPTNQTRFIAIDNNDIKWVGTWQEGLLAFNDEVWEQYTIENSRIPSNSILSLDTDSDNNVWIGTSSGLTKFDGTDWFTYNEIDEVFLSNVNSVFVDESDNVWFTNNDNNLIKFNGTVMEVFKNENSSGFHSLGNIVIDENSVVWMTDNQQIASFDNGTWEYFNHSNGDNNDCLTDCQPISMAIDINNDLWVGQHEECLEGGLSNFSACENYFTTNSDLPDNNILSLNIDDRGVKWIGTFNGVAKLTTASTLNINEFSSEVGEVLFYPNPSEDFLMLEIKENVVGATYTITDTSGRRVKQGVLNSTKNEINLTSLNQNLYVLNILGKTINKSIKIVKTK